MSQIQNWTRETHRNLNDDAVQSQIEEHGKAAIASWIHEPTQARLAYLYEPEADNPYIVVLTPDGDDDISFDQEGRYSTRRDGGKANKDLMRDNVEIPELTPEEHVPEDYEDLNVDDTLEAISDWDDELLEQFLEYEQEHQDRKTVKEPVQEMLSDEDEEPEEEEEQESEEDDSDSESEESDEESDSDSQDEQDEEADDE